MIYNSKCSVSFFSKKRLIAAFFSMLSIIALGSGCAANAASSNINSALVVGESVNENVEHSNPTDEVMQNKTLSYLIPHTGQINAYGNTTEIKVPESQEAFYGQDANYIINPMQYKNNEDGTVTDVVTGLMWQSEHNPRMSYEEAKSKAESLVFAGYDDWRLPAIKELYSLIDYSGYTGKSVEEYSPFINTDFFTFTFGAGTVDERIIDCQYWSSTKYVSTTMNNASTVFGVNFADGRIKGYPEKNPQTSTDHTMYSIFVRGGEEYGINYFVDNGDSTITDNATGLMWSKDDSGVGMSWEEALSYAENATLSGYSDWRLPSAKELQSIVDYTRSPDTTNSAAINPIFNISEISDSENNMNYPYFWTGTTLLEKDKKQFATEAIYVAFGEAQSYMSIGKQDKSLMDVHGAGAVRSDPKTGDPSEFLGGRGPQGDEVLINNYVRLVRTQVPATNEEVIE